METTKQTRNKKIVAVTSAVMALLMLIVGSVPVTASEPGIMPIYDHCNYCNLSFYVMDGVAGVSVDYYGKRASFSYIEISVKIQRNTWWIFWETVDLGGTDNPWVYTSNEIVDLVNREFPVSETGTYRAIFNIKFYGDNSVVDEIEQTIEYEYV